MCSRRCSRKGFFFERCGVLKLLVIVGTFATISASTEASRHEQEKEKEEAKKLRFSVATLVSGGSTRHDGQDGYTLGAVSLAGSIREASRIRGVDLVAMVTPDVSLSNSSERPWFGRGGYHRKSLAWNISALGFQSSTCGGSRSMHASSLRTRTFW
mmetsp:Transcript_61717/g.123740  ORF Transcript_61717/g.123740 Transcript_61717/m.123740 type:complete len:156 (-) Transcript_61717:1346-1813(-)